MKKIPVIEPVKDTKEFSSIDEFNVFYNEHKDEFEKQTTCKLNKKYKIPGYKITKIQGTVKLKNIPESRKTALDKVNAASDRITFLEQSFNSLAEGYNDIASKFNNTLREVRELRQIVTDLNDKISTMEKQKTTATKEPISIPHFMEDEYDTEDDIPPPQPKPSKPEKVKFDDNGSNMKRNASPRKPGQMMDTARAWLGL